MQNFITKPVMALVLRKGISIAAGTTRLRSVDYEALLDIEQAKEATKQELERMMKEAREEGLRQGREDAQKELLDNISQMKSNMENWVQDTDQKLVELVGACVQEVVQKVDCVDIIRESVQKGLQNLHNAQAVELRVHPKYQEEAAQILAQLAPNLSTRVVVDSTLEESDCVVRSPVGSVDLRLGTRIRNIKETLGL